MNGFLPNANNSLLQISPGIHNYCSIKIR